MEIKIIGSNCKNGMHLYKSANRVASNVFQDIQIEKLDDVNSINKYGVKNIPGLVINNKLVSQGTALSEKEICRLIRIT